MGDIPDYDEMEQAVFDFMNENEDRAIYIKAENVELRAHLVDRFGHMIDGRDTDEFFDFLRKLEQYIKYG